MMLRRSYSFAAGKVKPRFTQLLINGKFVNSTDGRTFDTFNPSTEVPSRQTWSAGRTLFGALAKEEEEKKKKKKKGKRRKQRHSATGSSGFAQTRGNSARCILLSCFQHPFAASF